MRLRTISLAVLCSLAAVIAPTTASAKLSVGISDNHPVIFGDPAFTALKAKRVRVVAAWNAVGQFEAGADNEVSDKLDPYVNAAKLQGIEVMIAVEHGRGAPINCGDRSNRKEPHCTLPSVSAYKAEFAKLVARYPSVRYFTAWNEANHNTQPTQGNPGRAGQFAKAADSVCRAAGTCRVVAMDILDAANNPKLPVKRLSYSRTTRYIKKLRKAYGKSRPSICGIHNYADVNRFRTKGTKKLTKAMKCKSYWLTETGGFYNFASFWKSRDSRKNAKGKGVGKCTKGSNCQVAALKYLFKKTVKAARHIDRAYIYNFYSGEDGRFDAGLTKGSGATPTGAKRPGYSIVKAKL